MLTDWPNLRTERDTDTYLTAFEDACHLNQVPSAKWLHYLNPWLGPKAVEAYNQMNGADCKDYEQFKKKSILLTLEPAQENTLVGAKA